MKQIEAAVRSTAKEFNVKLPEPVLKQIDFLTRSFIKQQLANFKSVDTGNGPPYVVTDISELSSKRRHMFSRRIGPKVSGMQVALSLVKKGWYGLSRDYPLHWSFLYVSDQLWKAATADDAPSKGMAAALIEHFPEDLKLEDATTALDVREIAAYLRKSKQDQSKFYLEFSHGLTDDGADFIEHRKDSRYHIGMEEMSDIVSLFGSGQVGILGDRDQLLFFTPYIKYLIEF